MSIIFFLIFFALEGAIEINVALSFAQSIINDFVDLSFLFMIKIRVDFESIFEKIVL